MDIADVVSDDYVEFSPEGRVSKLVGACDDSAVPGGLIPSPPDESHRYIDES